MGGRVVAPQALGQQLRAAREKLGWDIRQASAATAIPPGSLKAIEDGRLDLLPSPVYTRGYVRTYATALHLDGDAFTYAFCQLQPEGRFDAVGSISRARGARLPRLPRFPRPSRLPAASPGGPSRRVAKVLGIVLGGFLGLLVLNALWAAVGPDADDGVDTPRAAPTTVGTGSSAVVPPPPTTTPGPLVPTSGDTEGAVYTLGRQSFAVAVEPVGRVWVQMRAGEDGEVVFEGTLTQGQNQSVPATGELWVRVGNQANVRVLVDGTPLAVPAGSDEPYNFDLRT